MISPSSQILSFDRSCLLLKLYITLFKAAPNLFLWFLSVEFLFCSCIICRFLLIWHQLLEVYCIPLVVHVTLFFMVLVSLNWYLLIWMSNHLFLTLWTDFWVVVRALAIWFPEALAPPYVKSGSASWKAEWYRCC